MISTTEGTRKQTEWTQTPYKEWLYRHAIYCYTNSLTEYTLRGVVSTIKGQYHILLGIYPLKERAHLKEFGCIHNASSGCGHMCGLSGIRMACYIFEW